MSEIKVNKISPRAACGTVQLGDSGDTFTIPAGATINNQGTATNFGATGSASWVTTVKTSTFTAVAGEGYFVNTTGGAVTVNLPAGTAGAVVAIKDYAGTFDTNAVTLAPNGSDKIGGDGTTDATLSTEGIAVTLVFIDSTQGWLVTDSGLQSEAPTASFIVATGGTISTCGNFKTHVFTGPGTFTVCSVGNAGGSSTVDYMVVAGGGGGGRGSSPAYMGGGAGAGGFRISNSVGCVPAPAMSPLANPTGLPVSAQGYPIVVGGGGAAAPGDNAKGTAGVASSFSTISSAGGGQGGGNTNPDSVGGPGGSGGGGTSGGGGGTGNTPPVTPPQGNDGTTGPPGNNNAGGGGGGAGGAAVIGSPAPNVGSSGGPGSFVSNTFFSGGAAPLGEPGPVANTRYFAGGGAGSSDGPSASSAGNPNGQAQGGVGGGGNGGSGGFPGGGIACNGATNTGGGGGGGSGCGSAAPSIPGPQQGETAGAGGSGIVVIRYKFQ